MKIEFQQDIFHINYWEILGFFFFSLIQASVTCTFLLFLNALYFEFEIFLNNFPHE